MPKIERDAFLYLDGVTDDFAQCGSCWLYNFEEQRCCVLGPKLDVYPEDSCGYYGPGVPVDIPITARFTPEEVGFVSRQVRCENCAHFDAEPSECGLYKELNKKFPELFDLDPKVEAQGCCNAQTPKTEQANG